MQFQIMLRKELLENWRNFKWIWMPIVFIIFAIMDPITTYYLPIIMESVGGLPEGATFSIPMPNPAEAVLMSFSQLGTLGVLIIVVISMGAISGELKSGVYELILSKPVHYGNYITSKFISLSLISIVSLLIGILASWYYVNLLFGDLSLTKVLVATLFYACYLLYVIGVVILVNTLFKSPGAVAFISIIIIVVINLFSSIYQHLLTWSPALVSDHVFDYLLNGKIFSDLWISALVALIISIGCLIFATTILKNRALD
ncbi:ABC transporter permease [Bacillaceae bacterium W0354]